MQKESAGSWLGSLRRFILRCSISNILIWLATPTQTIQEEESSDDDDDGFEDALPRTKHGRHSEEELSPLQRIVRSNGFELFSCVAILFNCVLLGMDAMCVNCSEVQKAFLNLVEHIMGAIFLAEWFFRVLADGRQWFRSGEHKFDTLLVWVPGVGLLWVLPAILDWKSDAGSLLSGLHALRALRLMRLFNVIKRFTSFRLLLAGVLSSHNTLLACCTLIVATTYLFACMAIELVGNSVLWENATAGMPAHSFQQGLVRAMFMMSQFTTGDNAITPLEGLLEEQPMIWVFFFGFTAVSSYVLLNLVTAVIVEHALEITQASEAEAALEQRRVAKHEMKELRQLFKNMDWDNSGCVSQQEFEQAFREKRCKDKLTVLGLEVSDLRKLYKTLDNDGQGSVDVDEFCDGMKKMKGEATSKDMLYAQKTVEKVQKEIKRLNRKRMWHDAGDFAIKHQFQDRRWHELVSANRGMRDAGDDFKAELHRYKESVMAALDAIDPQITVVKEQVERLLNQVRIRKSALASANKGSGQQTKGRPKQRWRADWQPRSMKEGQDEVQSEREESMPEMVAAAERRPSTSSSRGRRGLKALGDATPGLMTAVGESGLPPRRLKPLRRRS